MPALKPSHKALHAVELTFISVAYCQMIFYKFLGPFLTSIYSLNIKADDRRCLIEARVPIFNGEKIDLKPAITSFCMYFYVIPSFSPLKLGTRASLRHVVCHHLKSVKLFNIRQSYLHVFHVVKC